MLNPEEAKARILTKMRDLGFKVEAEGVKSGLLPELLVELMQYMIENNDVQVDTGSGKGKFG